MALRAKIIFLDDLFFEIIITLKINPRVHCKAYQQNAMEFKNG